MHELRDFPLAYEESPSAIEELMAKIRRRTSSLKVRATEKAWVARIRIKQPGGGRKEYSEIANGPREALIKLDKTLEKAGIYDEKN